MEVILLEKIRNLGNLGDKISVKPGFGRNFLIPTNKAVFATPANLKQFEARRAELEKNAAQTFSAAQQQAAKLSDITLTISSIASDEGKLYGSVGVNEIKDALVARAIEINKREIILSDGAFHAIGNYTVQIQLHSDVVADLQIEIVPA